MEAQVLPGVLWSSRMLTQMKNNTSQSSCADYSFSFAKHSLHFNKTPFLEADDVTDCSLENSLRR